jgi:hypothetical protein
MLLAPELNLAVPVVSLLCEYIVAITKVEEL